MLDPETEHEYEKRFGTMSGKTALRQVRRDVRKTIRDSASHIAKEERILQALRTKLEHARMAPNAEPGKLQKFEESFRAYEALLEIVKSGHNSFVREQSKPSLAFPNGIQIATYKLFTY